MRNAKLEERARKLTPTEPCHDFSHTLRVIELAECIAEVEGGNREIIYLAALLHDIGRSVKGSDRNHALIGADLAKEILKDFGYADEVILAVIQAISSHSKKAGVPCESLEAKILYDADKVDAFGAIGLARLFLDAGDKNIPIYKYSSEIKKDICTNLMEEDRQIVSGLYTTTGRQMCEERLHFQERFLIQLKQEIGMVD